jgi:hypothetical protein
VAEDADHRRTGREVLDVLLAPSSLFLVLVRGDGTGGRLAAVLDLEQEAVLLADLGRDGLVDGGSSRRSRSSPFSSEMSLKGLSPSATAKSRTMIGGLRWMIFTPPSSVTVTLLVVAAAGISGARGAGLATGGEATGALAGGGTAGAGRATGALKVGTGRSGGGMAGPGRGAITGAGGGAFIRGDGGGLGATTGVGGSAAARAAARAASAALAASSFSRAMSAADFTKTPAGSFTCGGSAATWAGVGTAAAATGTSTGLAYFFAISS